MNIRSRHVCSLILMVVSLLLSDASGGAHQQVKSADIPDADRVYKKSELDEREVIDHKSRLANFPKAAGCVGRGSVLLRVVLHSSGKVKDVEVLEKGKCRIFEERAISAVQKIKFKPAKKGGREVSTYAMFEYSYKAW